MDTFFSLLAHLIGIYSFLCLIRIVISYFPQMQNNRVADFLASICDPFFSLFRFSFSKIGAFDLSAFFAIAALYIAQKVFHTLSLKKDFNAFSIITILLSVSFSIADSLLTFLLIVLIFRFILEITGKSYNSVYTDAIDSVFTPLYNLANRLTGNSYIASLVVLAVGSIVLKIIIFIILMQL